MLGMGWFPDQKGGLNRYLAGLHRELVRQGVAARAVVLGPAAGLPDGVHLAADGDAPLPARMRGFARAARQLSEDIDVADVHFALYGLWPLLSRAWRGKPMVVHFQGPWAQESVSAGDRRWPRAWLKARVETAVYRRANALVVLSSAFKRVLVESYGVSPWRVTVIPPGVDLEEFEPGSHDVARRALGLEPGTFTAVVARRLVPRMGIDVLLEAWVTVARDSPGACLLVVGEGPERTTLEAQAARSAPAGSVRFLGAVGEQELKSCYRAADVVVVPSRELEGYGLVVLESLASGTPVVVSDAGGLPEAVIGLDPSLVVPAGDAGALAARINAAADGSRPLPARDDCRRFAEAFSWPAVARRNQDVYAAAVDPARDRRKRVVYLDHCARISGGELAMLRLLPAMEQVDCHVILGEEGPLVGRLLSRHVSTEVLPLGSRARNLSRSSVTAPDLPVLTTLQTALYILRLTRRLRRLRPDLVHTNSLKSLVYGGVAGRLAGVPVVCHVRDRLSDDYLPAQASMLVRGILKRFARAVITNSHATREALRVDVAATEIPSPVTYDPVRQVARRSGGSASEGLTVTMLGRLAPWKGQHLFIEAFAAAFPAGGARALVVGGAQFGEQEYEADMLRLASALGIAARVEFLGHVDDVDAVLDRTDILVHASVGIEPFGLVVAEGMAAGLAVVATDVGGPSEIIEDGVSGVLFRTGDPEDLARVMRLLADQPELRARLGTGARAAARRFAPEVIAREVNDLYDSILRAS
ncbi:MAG: hypothetical protein QOK05_2970 [Chloroflexota bacterium]|jgi:glycosyltransferase involved in cell wall biosynthesis|nr:hypothetical protein [Chloroflexota bacterium]